jgi:hypothetical protein
VPNTKSPVVLNRNKLLPRKIPEYARTAFSVVWQSLGLCGKIPEYARIAFSVVWQSLGLCGKIPEYARTAFSVATQSVWQVSDWGTPKRGAFDPTNADFSPSNHWIE